MRKTRKESMQSSNPWSPSDERAHSDSMIEWWCAQALLKSPTISEQLSFKATLTQWNEHYRIGSIFHQTLHKQHDDFTSFYRRNEEKQLVTKDDPVTIRFEKNSISGTFPDYTMKFHDTTHDISLDLSYHAEVMPHWVAQSSTNGWLPMGIGTYRYGFIPKLTVNGSLKQNDTIHEVNGTGYYEHVWGDFLYDKPLSSLQELPKTIGTYARLFYWWASEYQPWIPNNISLCTENNPFGYDWVWATLDNGWTLFFGNILLWLMNGPVAGILIINKEDGSYEERGNISFQYHHTKPSDHFDFVYPSDFEITAKKENEIIHLRFQMTGDTHEYIARFPYKGFYIGFVICEAPGKVTGFIEKNGRKTPVSGVCKIEPQRQISKLGHNMMSIDWSEFLKKGHVKTDLISHFFGKQMCCSYRLLPRPHFSFHQQRINDKHDKSKKRDI